METREAITLNTHAQRRLLVLTHVLAGELDGRAAAEILGLSGRQVRRLLDRYRGDGAAAFIHGNRGRAPANRVEATTRARVVELATTTYAGFNPVHLAETLAEEQGLVLSARTVRRVLVAAGVPQTRTRRPRKHRSRRERMPRAGMLLQVDGSRHDWLEGRGPMLTLVGGIDDATGIFTGATFRLAEDAAGYFTVLTQTAAAHGLPVALYSDQHGIFVKDPARPPSLAEQLAGKRAMTQVRRALEEAGVGWIGATSAQAKGRIERGWGTAQDRLRSELRRAGAATIEEANAVLARYLVRHNERFAVPAADPTPAWQAWPDGRTAETVFSFHYPRRVARDATISWEGQALALPARADGRSWAGAGVIVEERLDGSLWVSHAGTAYRLTDAPPGPVTLRARHLRREPLADLAAASTRREPVPPLPSAATSSHGNHDPNHPWRRYAAVRPR
ncbi:MAG: ISNCY family transposase [Chloroflexota bacterium]|nr:MAG: ISNCY family transposase [Chloroflexota bacterium]